MNDNDEACQEARNNMEDRRRRLVAEQEGTLGAAAHPLFRDTVLSQFSHAAAVTVPTTTILGETLLPHNAACWWSGCGVVALLFARTCCRMHVAVVIHSLLLADASSRLDCLLLENVHHETF